MKFPARKTDATVDITTEPADLVNIEKRTKQCCERKH